MDKASDFELEDCGLIPITIVLTSLFIRTYCYCTTEANGNSWTLESMVRTVLTVFRKHLGTYIVYLQ